MTGTLAEIVPEIELNRQSDRRWISPDSSTKSLIDEFVKIRCKYGVRRLKIDRKRFLIGL